MGRIAVVSGANQGLGFALAEGLARRLAHGDSVYLTGRSAERLGDAATRISAPIADVDTHVLDVRDGAAVTAFADELRDRHGGVDVVFSNAAARLTPDTPWAELVGPFVDTNNLGTTRMLRAFSPILRRRPVACGGQRLRHAQQPARVAAQAVRHRHDDLGRRGRHHAGLA